MIMTNKNEMQENEKCMFFIYIEKLNETFGFEIQPNGSIEHDYALADDFCGNFIVLKEGKVYAYIHDSNTPYIYLFETEKKFFDSITLLTYEEYQAIIDNEMG